MALAIVKYRRGDLQDVLAETERALAIAPSLAKAHEDRGAVLIYSGNPKEGLASLETSSRLDPHSWSQARRLHTVQIGHYFCRDYEASIEAAKRVIWAYPEYAHAYRRMAAALGQLGRFGEAKEALENTLLHGSAAGRGQPPASTFMRGECTPAAQAPACGSVR